MTLHIGSGADRYGAYAAGFCIAAGLVAAFTPWIIHLGHKYDWVDRPERRKVHSRPIPRVGGLAVFLGILAAFAAITGASPVIRELIRENSGAFTALAAGAMVLLLVGFWDDIRGISPRTKLVFQIAAGLIAYFGGFHFAVFTNGIAATGPHLLLHALGMGLTLLWTVGTTNAVNLVDGLDGLAPGIAGIAMFLLAIISEHNGHFVAAFTAILSAGAVAGFLFYNKHPASIFLGDSGSLVLGYLLAVLSIVGTQQGSLYASLVTPACLAFVPLLDITFAMVRRAQNGMPVSSADKEHIHHRLIRQGIPYRRAVHILWGVTTAAGLLAVLMHLLPGGYRHALVNLLAVVCLLAAVRYLGKAEMRATLRTLGIINRRKRTPREQILWLRRCLQELDACETAQGLLESVGRIADGLDVESVSFYLRTLGEGDELLDILHWKRAPRGVQNRIKVWEESGLEIVFASKSYLGGPDSTVFLELGRQAWKARRRSEDFQLCANLIVDKLAEQTTLAIFVPARTLPYSAILGEA
jgi:UDP-GlcNAc:undecaprenyl-phosphate/decaprenyl-phosphate GlcNAc-1-phosphate transferase